MREVGRLRVDVNINVTTELPSPPQWDGLFRDGLPLDAYSTSVAYSVWAETLVPLFPSAFLTLTSGRAWTADVFNDARRTEAPQTAKDILNVLERRAYGPRYRKKPAASKFDYFLRAETRSKTGAEVHLHWHLLMAASRNGYVPFSAEYLQKSCDALVEFFKKKHSITVEPHFVPVANSNSDRRRVTAYVTKRIMYDADLIFVPANTTAG